MSNEKYENKVELIGTYGSDLTHALAAWTSTNRELTDEKRQRIGKLLLMLGKEGHTVPFEHSMISFLIDVEIASHIQNAKHRIGVSTSSESARWKELKEDKFYLPVDWSEEERLMLKEHCLISFKKYHECMARLLASGVSKKRAKETARFYLPYANQLQSAISFNFLSFMHYQKLRNSEAAQKEIRDLAKKMLILVYETGQFDMSLEAFGWNKEKIYQP